MKAITAEFPGVALTAGAADAGRRTITGIAVPYGVPGSVSDGTIVVFEPGSLDAAARPPLLLDHDRTRPIGTVVDARDIGSALEATGRVLATPRGDDALVEAAAGARSMFSVGVEPTDATFDADGVLRVTAAVWRELSLLTIGAYDAARVSTVTAAREGAPMTMTDDPTTPTPVDPDVPDVPDDDDTETNEDIEPDVPTVEAAARPVPLSAARGRRPGAAHPYAGVGIREFAGLINASLVDPRIAAQVQAIQMSPGARTVAIQAALDDVKMVGAPNVGSLVRPGYQAELVEIVSHGSPVVDAIRQGDLQRGDYPNVTFNQWTATPQVALQAGEKDEINSTPVSAAPVSVPVQTWATGNDISQQVLDFGSPSFIEDYIRMAGVDYAQVIDLYAINALLAAAINVTTTAADNFMTVLGKLFGALVPTAVPAGRLVLFVAYDVGIGLMSVPDSQRPAFWDGTISFNGYIPTANLGGLQIVVDPQLPSRTWLLMLANAATWYDLPGTPFSLRAINVGQLGLDVAVYGYGALGVQYPGAIVKTVQPLT